MTSLETCRRTAVASTPPVTGVKYTVPALAVSTAAPEVHSTTHSALISPSQTFPCTSGESETSLACQTVSPPSSCPAAIRPSPPAQHDMREYVPAPSSTRHAQSSSMPLGEMCLPPAYSHCIRVLSDTTFTARPEETREEQGWD